EFISENTDQVKQNIANNTDLFNQHSSEDEESLSELSSDDEECSNDNNESSSKKLKMASGTADISSRMSEKRAIQISSENEERGVFKCRISGKDIEVETHGNIMLTQLYGVL